MPGPVVTAASVAMCPHGGPVSIVSSDARVLASGAPVATIADQFMVAGCAFTIPPPLPCLMIQWLMGATRVLINGIPPVLADEHRPVHLGRRLAEWTTGRHDHAAPSGRHVMSSSIEYPFQFDGRGRTALAGDTDHIEQMIEQVLFTSPGERVNRPTFGCGLLQMPFEPNDDRLQQTMEFLIRGSLSQWLGTLIDTQSINVSRNENVFSVDITYVIRKTKRAQSASFERTV